MCTAHLLVSESGDKEKGRHAAERVPKVWSQHVSRVAHLLVRGGGGRLHGTQGTKSAETPNTPFQYLNGI